MSRLAILSGLALLAAVVLARIDLGREPLAAEAPPGDAPAARAGAATDAPHAADEEKPPTPGDEGSASGGEYAGDETCAACHEEIAGAVHRTAHGTAQRAEWKDRGCEGCHGPGQKHVDDGGGTGNIRSLKDDMPATARAGACLACHGGDPHLREVRGGEHLSSDVACSACHEPHARGVGDAMLRKPQAALCMSCHLDVRAAYAMPYRHGITEGRIECGGCHDPHGSRNAALLRAPNDRTCFGCHAELQGPWVFEHTSLVSEGCTSCHVPHGGDNRHLLRRQQVAQLCYQCHTLTPRTHAQPSFRDCTRCHVWVHGSNTDPRFLEP